MRVSKADLQYYNLTSIPLADGSGYAAELGVFHELHCLVRFPAYPYASKKPPLIGCVGKDQTLDIQRPLFRERVCSVPRSL